MITQLRIDDRLIHGQVALVWTKELNTPGIVVANDNASTNDVLKMTLQMAVPSGKKLLVKSVDDAIKVFNNPKGEKMRIFALTNNVADALKIVQNCQNVESVNVANVGRFDGSDDKQKVRLSDTIILNPDELKAIEELSEQQVPVFQQLIPSNARTPIKKLIKNHTERERR